MPARKKKKKLSDLPTEKLIARVLPKEYVKELRAAARGKEAKKPKSVS
jgi:hypothetical protein